MTISWDPDFAARAPMFEPLQAAAAALRTPYWPGCDDLNRVAAARGMVNAGGRPLRFVEPPPRRTAFEDKFEPRIFLRGEVQLRACNWHDLLNALVWFTFPAAKAALNRRHYVELERQRPGGAQNRGPAQDALTLFDEGGVIVVTADPALGGLLASHAWKDLFWRRREDVMSRMRFYLFGHALYEKALAPFAGVTGRGVIFETAADFLAQPPASQLPALDERLARRLNDPAQFTATRELAAVPLLGIPGWCADNGSEEYYDDTGYFRPSARRR